jgi:small subunit ribosomal protein S4e
MGKFWSIPKKGTKFVPVATHNAKTSVPLLVVMRDILKLAQNKKELQKILNAKQIIVNNKEIRETNYPIGLFDIITLPGMKKHYRSMLSKQKKMVFEEISDKESATRPYRVEGKKILPKKKFQLNLSSGSNVLSEEKAKVGDSVILNLKTKKVLEVLPMKKGQTAYVIEGKYAGRQGKIEDIVEQGNKKIAKILAKDKEKINVWIKNIIIIK